METAEYKVVACWIDDSNGESMMVVSEFGVTEDRGLVYGLSESDAISLAKRLENEGYFGVEVREVSLPLL